MAKIKQIKIGGVTYDLKDTDLNILVNALLNETLSTDNQQNPNEKFWVPTTTDKASWDSLKVLKFFKADKTEVKNLFDGFTATLLSGSTDEYLLTIPEAEIDATTNALQVKIASNGN